MNIVLKVADTFTNLSKFSRLRCEKIGAYRCLLVDDMTGRSGVIGVFLEQKSPCNFCEEMLSALRTGGRVFDGTDYLYSQLPDDLAAEMGKHEAPSDGTAVNDLDAHSALG